MVTNKPTTIVQIMSQSDIMKNTNRQNYKINKKIWDEIEKQNNNGNENTEPEVPIEAESRDITFTATTEGNPMGANVPITVDGVTENTDENSQAVFNLVDGSHLVKIVFEGATYYYQTHITGEESITQSCNIEDASIEFKFIDENTKEVISDYYFVLDLFDVGANSYKAEGQSAKTGTDFEQLFNVPYTIRIKDGSAVLTEFTHIADSTTLTIEVPSPREVSFTVKDIENNPVASAAVSIDEEYSGDTGSDGGYTVLVQDGTHTIEIHKEISRDTYIRYNGSITVNSNNTHFDIVLEQSQQ